MRSPHLPAIAASLSLASSALAGGGDDALTAGAITALPFATAGDTGDNTDQFDVVCPFSGSTSPDAWYRYTTTAEQALTISVCESGYDTKLYVLDSNLTEIACNDDGCSDRNGNPFRSVLETPALPAGTLVYIVVDGYLGDFGPYALTVGLPDPPEPCVIECPDGGIPEGEDAGGRCDQTIDTNGGCDAPAPAFLDVHCGETVCGIAWADGGSRDTDWYRLDPAGIDSGQIIGTMVGEFNGSFLYLGEDPECRSVSVEQSVDTLPCATAEMTVLATGETWWFVAVNGFDLVPCGVGAPLGNDYVISWSCPKGPPPGPCPEIGDANGDGFVGFDDLLTVLANFGPCP
jgi:hypothetical protein